MRSSVFFVVALICVAEAPAAIIGIDFSVLSNSPTPVNWTRVTNPGTQFNLIDETGALTNVDLTVPVFSGAFSGALNAGTIPTHTNSIADVNEYFFDTTARTFTFDGLVPDAQYRLWVFGLRDAGVDNSVTVSGDSQQLAYNQTGAGQSLYINDELGDSSRSLLSYADLVTANGAGSLFITVSGGAGALNQWGIAGLAIELAPVPEPSTVALPLIAGAAYLAIARRRRRHAA